MIAAMVFTLPDAVFLAWSVGSETHQSGVARCHFWQSRLEMLQRMTSVYLPVLYLNIIYTLYHDLGTSLVQLQLSFD